MSWLIHSRDNRPEDDPIFALNAEAKARHAKGEDILNATIGALLNDDGSLAILPSVARALREVPAEVVAAYAPIAGREDFLSAVRVDAVGQYHGSSVAVATPGGTGALRHAITAFLEPGQSLLTSSYYWEPYQTIAAENERGIATFEMFTASLGFNVEAFEAALTTQLTRQGRALVVLNSPCHNPTGFSMSDDEWLATVSVLSRAAERGPITLVLDVAYAHFTAQPVAHIVQRLEALFGKVMLLVAWSGSKAFTFYGGRVGALVALHPDPHVLRKTRAALAYGCRGVWSNCNAGGMAAVAKALSDPSLKLEVQRERDALRALLDARATRFEALAAPAGLRFPRYGGGFFSSVFCKDAEQTADAMRKLGVYVVPIGADAVRVALCSVPEKRLERLVDALRPSS